MPLPPRSKSLTAAGGLSRDRAKGPATWSALAAPSGAPPLRPIRCSDEENGAPNPQRLSRLPCEPRGSDLPRPPYQGDVGPISCLARVWGAARSPRVTTLATAVRWRPTHSSDPAMSDSVLWTAFRSPSPVEALRECVVQWKSAGVTQAEAEVEPGDRPRLPVRRGFRTRQELLLLLRRVRSQSRGTQHRGRLFQRRVLSD